MTTPWHLSIDFGTSNTAAAHTAPVSGAVETLALSHAGNLMPSGVHMTGPDRIAVGDHAANEAHRDPWHFIPSPKRLVGQPSVIIDGSPAPTWLPISAVMRQVITRATNAHAGQPPASVVLTHPEAWTPAQVNVLIEATTRAGVASDTISTISEPRAAAAYYAGAQHLPANSTVCVFDFGGGTLDVAVLRSAPDGSFDVTAARGDNSLGGKNFDAAVRRWVDGQLAARNPALLSALNSDQHASAQIALDESIQRAKELLSDTPSATITAAAAGQQETLQITRSEFDEIIRPAVESGRDLLLATLADADQTGRTLDALYLTGGSSRIPLIHEVLQPIGPVATLDDPKTVVARGALRRFRPANVAPVFTDSTDRWSATNRTTATETTATPWFRRTPVLATAAVLVVAVTVGTVVLFSSSGNKTTTAAPPPSSASPRSATAEQILAALPEKLRLATRRCQLSTTGIAKVAQLQCGSSATLGLFANRTLDESSGPTVLASLDDANTRTRLQDMTDGIFGTYTPGSDDNSGSSIQGTSYITVYYANRSTGLTFSVGGLKDEASARAVLTELGLNP
ncbi:Hsp70 family protein [Williamsia sp. CHRR-6]|uniref:Hsp70 family protein n=1 Tax=Williamsia sp. CHRR-6 TaxID=2835871 RepID=UPI001BD9D608|nr:Hsp70 family protein [Williamsia sp. CHRR-6]MBT0568558.1 Hsp70 family protein [Williamsia sp. CHRR-6]